MLSRPPECGGCPLDLLASGFMAPCLSIAHDRYQVALLGEALGKDEAEIGLPFQGKAGHKLSRLIEWAGLEREKFDIYNAVWCRPPENLLEGQPYEYAAIAHCKQAHWERLLGRSNVIVPMGNVALGALTGEKGILGHRGYIHGGDGYHILPTVHPSFIARGQAKYAAAFIHDLQKAVDLSQNGLQPTITHYTLDPSPSVAYRWAQDYVEHEPSLLAFDIETPNKSEDESESDGEGSGFIWRIGFSYIPYHALSVPFTPEYFGTIRYLLESAGPKVVWNAEFDCPRLRKAGFDINGLIHDGMVAWHILHSDLPKGLGFVATFTCPHQPRWKHLSRNSPAFYNATDADVELRSFLAIQTELERTGLWRVYQEDVIELEPLLQHMSREGMPINPLTRRDRAEKLQKRMDGVYSYLVSVIPLEARSIDHVFVKTPKETRGLYIRSGTRILPTCSRCGLERPRKNHFTRFVKKTNPCADATIMERSVGVDEYYRLAEWKPSRVQLSKYHEVMNRPIPTTWDKKTHKRRVSFDEKILKQLASIYVEDPLYKGILEYRELEKIAGTYIGRPPNDS